MNPDDAEEYWLSETIEKDFGVYVEIVSGIEAFRNNYITTNKVSEEELVTWGNDYIADVKIAEYLQTEEEAEAQGMKNRHYHIAHDSLSGDVLGVAMHCDFMVNEYWPYYKSCNKVYRSIKSRDKKKTRVEDTEYLHFDGVDVEKTIDVSFICVNPRKSKHRPIGNMIMLNIMKHLAKGMNRILVNLGISKNTESVNPKMVDLLTRMNFTNVDGAFVEISRERFHSSGDKKILFEDDSALELFFVSQEYTDPMIEELFLDLLLRAKDTGVRVEDDTLCFENPCEGYPEFLIFPLETGEVLTIKGKKKKKKDATTRYAYEAMRKHMSDPTDLSFFDPLMYDHNPPPFGTTIICNANDELEVLLRPDSD
jgi:hypothetical protein